ncbi:MAG: DotU family type IV/VI secretion system protein [Alphaproteobacteria bacterium]|nr:DotU family type IV/VI secretion system protein [Alphaproteobacteria bacterium]
MPIIDAVTKDLLGTSDLRKMFGAFCCRIFSYRNDILSPVKSAESLATIDNIKQPQEYFKVIHHSISMLLKALMDNEHLSSFNKNSKEVIYAMTAIADEIFLNMDWNGKTYWEENMLETKFFGSQIAGEEIFDRINRLISEPEPLGTEKAEIYLNMLSLGFVGKFRGADNETTEIDMYRHKLFEFITKYDREVINVSEYRIFHKEYTFTMPTVRRKLLPDGSVVTYLSVFFLFMFISVSTIVWLVETRDLNILLNEISEIILRAHK